MRALAIVIALARLAHADGPRTVPIGFDHTVHARDVSVSGAEDIACSRCHDERNGRLVGRPSHAACFAKCHAPAPATPRIGAKLALDADRLKLCTNCHAESALVAPFTGKLAVTYPPYRIDRDFNIVLGHKHHAAFACTLCHDPIGHKSPAPHARCTVCHDGAAQGHSFAMATCEKCHPPSVGRPQPPELAALKNTVITTFSHATHQARGTKDCGVCHAAIRGTDETELPRPTLATCATCHDGKQAFATTVACTRCHDKAPDRYDVDRPDARFAHGGSHAQLVTPGSCPTCHVLDRKTGEVAIAGHAICSGCHADDFGARHPKRCGACHSATEPWRKLRADRPSPDTTEFGATLDHQKHASDCASCHAQATHARQEQLPHGHAACSGAKCHAASTGPAPHLSACDDCHRLGLVAERIAKRNAEPWSVRRAFDHLPHMKDATGAALACTACHSDLAAANVLALPTPAKPTCAPCHDGRQAFKLTGTTCSRCHVKS